MQKKTETLALESKKASSGKQYYKMMNYEKDPYNTYQNFLFRRALYGVAVYTEFELDDMDFSCRKKIEYNHHRTQLLINLWKQELINNAAIEFFNRVFPDCKYIDILKEPTKPDPYFRNHLSLKELGISKKDVIDKLILSKVLPPNFYQIKMESLNTLSFSKKFNY